MVKEKDIQQRANESYASRFDEEMRELVRKIDEFTDDEYEAHQRLEEMPLSVAALSTDWRREETTWEILLGTGGPADRVLVVADFRGSIQSVTYQFQDWFEPWTDAENQDAELVQRFAEIVGYFEDQPWGEER